MAEKGSLKVPFGGCAYLVPFGSSCRRSLLVNNGPFAPKNIVSTFPFEGGMTMTRYVITVLTIATIILAADSAGASLPSAAIESPASPVDAGLSEGREFTILTYNTHLFEDSILRVHLQVWRGAQP